MFSASMRKDPLSLFAYIFLALTIALSLCSCSFIQDDTHRDEKRELPVLEVQRPPIPVTDREVQAEVAAWQNAGQQFHHSLEEFDYLLDQFDRATTKHELNSLTGAALATLEHLHGQVDKDSLLFRLNRFYQAAGPFSPPFSIGDIGTDKCGVTFDTPGILDDFEDAAANTFTLPEYKWWEQPCGEGRIEIASTYYNHYHLGYSDPAVEFCPPNEHSDTFFFGKRNDDDVCIPINPVLEPRDVSPHWFNDLFIVRRLNDNDEPLMFNFDSFANVTSENVEIRFKRNEGQWFVWPSLAGNTVWNLSAFAKDVVEVHISHPSATPDCGPGWITEPGGQCSTETAIISVDNFSISI